MGRLALAPLRPSADDVRAWFDRADASEFIARDSELGWVLRINGRRRDGDKRYSTNMQGIRTPKKEPYPLALPADKLRIVAVGDSFTFGEEVGDSQTWAERLQCLQPRFEVLNLGVPGYGTDQACLRWNRDGRRFQSHIVLLGIWPEDICRNLNIVRFYMVPEGGFLTKPRFALHRGELLSINQPTMSDADLVGVLSNPDEWPLSDKEYWLGDDPARIHWWSYSAAARVAASIAVRRRRQLQRHDLYIGKVPEGVELTVALVRQLCEQVVKSGSKLVVVVFPMRELLARYGSGTPMPLVAALQECRLDVVDLTPIFYSADSKSSDGALFFPSGHLTPAGHELTARVLAGRLTPGAGAAFKSQKSP